MYFVVVKEDTMGILLVWMAVSFSAIFASGEVLVARGGMALSEASRRILFQRLPQSAGSALLEVLAADKTNSAWVVLKDLNISSDKWGIVTQVYKTERVASFGEITTFIANSLANANAGQAVHGKQLLENSELHLYIAVSHTPTLLSVYEAVTNKWPYEITHVTHIDLDQGEELFQLPRTFVVEGALEGTNNFSQALGKMFSFYGTDLETFSQQLQAAKNKHSGLFSGLIAERPELQQLEPAYPNSEAGLGGDAVHSPSPYISDIDQLAHSLGNSKAERNEQKSALRLLASTELIINDIEVLSQEFDAETAMPQELEQLMQEINATKTVVETTPAPETAVAKPERKKAARKEVKRVKEEERLPSVARPYGEFIRQARLSANAKYDGNEPTITWVTEELKGNGFTASTKTISNHENFWAIPSRDYLQGMIDAGYAELIAVDKETLWKVWELSQQVWEKEKVARRFGKLLKKKREAAGYDQRSTMINDLIRDSRGELSQEKFTLLENSFSNYERNRVLPSEATFKQLITAGFAGKIGVSAEELETVWREAKQAHKEAKEMAKAARALARGEAVTQELPLTVGKPVVVEADPTPSSETVEADSTPSSEVASESAPSGMSPVEIENMLKTLQEMQEKAPLPSVREVLVKEIANLEEQWLIEDEQRQARVEKEVKTALEKARAAFEQEIAAVREQYSEQWDDRLDEIYREVMRGL